MVQDWYRKQTWSGADSADFRARLQRARKDTMAQYLRIQAGTLMASGEQYRTAALGLLNEVLEDYPESLEVASALAEKGECLWLMGEVEAAAKFYAASVDRMRAMPKMQTDGWLDYGLLVATERLEARYADALNVLEEFSASWPLMLPVDWFKIHASRALIYSELGRNEQAIGEASLALNASEEQHSGVAYHPSIGLASTKFSGLKNRLKRMCGITAGRSAD